MIRYILICVPFMCDGSANICFGCDDASNQLEWRGTPLNFLCYNQRNACSLFLLMELDLSCEREQPGHGTVHMEQVCINGEPNAKLIAIARVARLGGWDLAGRSSSPRGCEFSVSHRGSPPIIFCCLSRGATKGMRRASSSTGSWLDPVISQRTQFSDLSIVVGLFVYAWYECGVRV